MHACVNVCLCVCQPAEDDDENAEYLRLEAEAKERYAKQDAAVTERRLFPPGTIARIRVYDPSQSGTASAAFSGVLLSLLLALFSVGVQVCARLQ